METSDRLLADKLYADGQRRMTLVELAQAWLIRLLLAVWTAIDRLHGTTLIILVVWLLLPVTTRAEGPHHVYPAWGKAAEGGQLCTKLQGCWRWVRVGSEIFGYGPNPDGVMHMMVRQNGRFSTQYAISYNGFLTVVRERVARAGGSIFDAVALVKRAARTSGAATAFAKAAPKVATTAGVKAAASRAASALAGRAGIGALFVPCRAIEEVLAGVRCTEGLKQ